MQQNAWHTLGTPAPLKERWDECAARMIAAGQTPIHPISEPSLFRMLEYLKANEPRPERTEPSTAEKLADAELNRVLTIYDDLFKRVLDEQKSCKRPHIAQRAAALGLSIDDAMMAKPPVVTVTGRGPAAVPEARAATDRINGLIYHVRDQLTKLEGISKLQSVDLDTVIFALGSRIGALEDRLLATETELQQLKQQKGKAHARR
jgi:hypothetical protein